VVRGAGPGYRVKSGNLLGDKKVKRPIKKAIVVLTGTAVMLAAVGAVAFANGFFEADGTVHFCSDAATRAARLIMVGESCFDNEYGVDIQSGGAGGGGPAGPTGPTGPTGPAGPAGVTNVIAVFRPNGPANQTANHVYVTIATLSGVPAGNYVAFAKTRLDEQLEGTSFIDFECQLLAGATVVDNWEEEYGFSTAVPSAAPDSVANLQRPITLLTTSSVQLQCRATDNSLDQPGTSTWKASFASIMLIPATSINETIQ
jgi:hypothetical protein